ncbi:hypothetical protein SCRES3_gp77 [Synechococcus phage S-CRES3]|nr:hypothetical protein SCRES3_gp77 [Synechococcus phage S-CRES3]
MASPLLPYANARVMASLETAPTLVNGRFVAGTGENHLFKCFMKRAQYSGVSSGSKKLPLESQLDGNMMPGASGDSFYYRGYALQYAVVPADFDPATDSEDGLTWVTITSQPEALYTGREVSFHFGNDKPLTGRVERSSGIFGGQGIDEIIYKEIGGVQLQISGAELQN